MFFGGGGSGGEVGENSEKKIFFFFGGGGGFGLGGGGQGGCESRIEVFWKIQKKKIRGGGRRVGPWGGPGWGVRMDVNKN